MAEIIRAGILSVPKGQMDAGLSIGLERGQTMRRIILPQTLRVIIPPTGNQFIGLLKASSLVSVIGGGDLLTQVEYIYGRNFLVIPLLIVASTWYLVLVTITSVVLYVARIRARPDRAPAGRSSARSGGSGVTPCRSRGDRLDRGRRRRRSARSSARRGQPARADGTGRCFGSAACTSGWARTTCSGASTWRSIAARSSSSSVRPARARARCFAASTISSESTPARSPSATSSSGTSCGSGELYEQSDREVAAIRREDRVRLPAVQPVSTHDGARERHVWPDPCSRPAARVTRSNEAGQPKRVGLEDKAHARPPTAVRRTAAARGDRPRPRHGAAADAVRRADELAGPRAGRRRARGHEGHRRRRA